MRQPPFTPDSPGAALPAPANERAVIDAAIAVNHAATFDEALAVLAETGLELVGAASASIAIWDQRLTQGVVRAGAGEAAARVGTVLLPGDDVAYDAAANGAPAREQSGANGDAGASCRIAVPLEIEGLSRITFEAAWEDCLDGAGLDAAAGLLSTLGRLTAIASRAARERDRASDQASIDATIEAVGDGVVILRGKEWRMNAAARRILGAHDGALPPSTDELNIRTIDGRPMAPEDVRAVLRSGEVQRFRHRITNLVGEELVVDGTISPIEHGGGIVALFRDVTSEHLREFLNEQYLRTLFDAIPTAILLVDPATRAVVSGNRAFRDLIGYELEDVIGRTPPYPWWAASDDAWVKPDAGGNASYERLYRRSDGRLVPVLVNSKLIRDHDDRDLSQLALITDLSDRRRLDQQLVQSGKLAAIGELAAGVAHEINNPLFAILGLVEFLLKDAEPGSKAHERLTLVQQTGLEIKEIVRSLLDFARENSEERHLVALEEVVAQTIDLIRRTSASKGIELVERYESGGAIVNASPNQIKQIFLNLLGNSRQAMPEGGTITVEVRREGDRVLAHVADTGPGIAHGLETRIFEPFFTTKRDSGGTGLGLSVSLGIAEAHGGSLIVEPPDGTGAAFTLHLPIAQEAT